MQNHLFTLNKKNRLLKLQFVAVFKRLRGIERTCFWDNEHEKGQSTCIGILLYPALTSSCGTCMVVRKEGLQSMMGGRCMDCSPLQNESLSLALHWGNTCFTKQGFTTCLLSRDTIVSYSNEDDFRLCCNVHLYQRLRFKKYM